ncbi:Tetratricopeptide repeat-containing protein [Tenacibaculum sp. 190524A02b]|uniref:tetratricopeptide repeat protein n=1 Tax=Tenacibaculum vairaonense TaxID=3137860 RepID=UPI0032B30AED
MNKLKFLAYIFLYSFLLSKTIAQSTMNKGFIYLEKGDFAKAELFFEDFLEKHPKNKTAKLCYGRALGLNGNPSKAKLIFDELLSTEPKNLEFNINAAECLLWNKEFDLALEKYIFLQKNYPENPIIELGLANTYSNLKKYHKAIQHYQKSIKLNNKILGIYIGLAYTYQANNQDKFALYTIEEALKLNSNNKQLISLKNTIQKKYRPRIEQKEVHTFDNGHNISRNSITRYIHPISTKTSIGFSYNYRSSKNDVLNQQSNQYTMGIGFEHYLTNKIKLIGGLNYLKTNGFNNSYNDLTYSIGSKIKLGYNQNLNFSFQKEYHNFNAQLINSEIYQNHLSLNYHILTKYKIGWFTQYYFTSQSDDNIRNLWFNSIYYLLKKETPFKIGINTLLMGFKKERAEVYFSPERYFVFEGFVDYSIFKHSDKWKLNFIAAYGFQEINATSSQQSFRTELNFGYQLSKKLSFLSFYKHSNQAVENAAGFEFNELGLLLKYRF